jgi:small subunit ribosomal protein S20
MRRIPVIADALCDRIRSFLRRGRSLSRGESLAVSQLYREDISTVARHSSALKAHRQSLKRRERNRHLRSRLRTAIRDMRAALDEGNTVHAQESLRSTVSLIDKMVTKGIIHGNTAARHKSRLSKRLQQATAPAA